jgi:hypothetical protein
MQEPAQAVRDALHNGRRVRQPGQSTGNPGENAGAAAVLARSAGESRLRLRLGVWARVSRVACQSAPKIQLNN